MKLGSDFMDYLQITKDPEEKKMIRQHILQLLDENTEVRKAETVREMSTREALMLRLRNMDCRNSIVQQVEDCDYEDNDEEGFKREKAYQLYEPPRFRVLGSYLEGKVKKPIIKMTDFYTTYNAKVLSVIDSNFKSKIYGKKLQAHKVDFTATQEQEPDMDKLLSVWGEKDEDDLYEADRNRMSARELEKTVINLGDHKENYFLHIKGQPRPDLHHLYQPAKNNLLTHSNFLYKLWKAVATLTPKYKPPQPKFVDPQDEEKEDGTQKKERSYFGEPFLPRKDRRREMRSSIVDESIALQKEKQYIINVAEKIYKQYSYVNRRLLSGDYHKPIQEHNKIQFDLSNRDFFLPKLHTVLAKGNTMQFMKQVEHSSQHIAAQKQGNQRSVISGSIITGRKYPFSKPSIIESSYNPAALNAQVEVETFEKRIMHEIKNVVTETFQHSDLAKKFQLVRFSFDEREFAKYHRYDFPYRDFFHYKTKVEPVYHKLKRKKEDPTDLSLNRDMMAPHIKFSKRQNISLASGDFILIQYIEETPLLMSNSGMCQKMILQVNYQQMLSKIEADLIKDEDFDEFEKRREKMLKVTPSSQHERKCQLWRRNIRQEFGENGKVMFWDPKNKGKLIGNPEGLGVAVMESNLATYPVVKKKSNPTDFILVREGKKWFLRRIDHIYVSGQIQPHRKVFNPESREYYLLFRMNYQKAYIQKQFLENSVVSIDRLKTTFHNESDLKKVLKKMHCQTRDGKNYTVIQQLYKQQFELSPEQVCLYERMQKSVTELREFGIVSLKCAQKIKNVLKEFNKQNLDNLNKYALAKYIKERFQLTSWYLTQSFWKYANKSSKIQIVGHADPTNGRSGYSYINKPQKERTAKEDLEEKKQKKVSGTKADLRKLDNDFSKQFLMQKGYNPEELEKLNRWELVTLIKKEEDTQYARKERETKLQKLQNEKKQISKIFNKMLSNLKGQEAPQGFNYHFKKYLTLPMLAEREAQNWKRMREKTLKMVDENNDEGDDD